MQCCQNCATAIVFQQGQSYAIYIIYSAHTIYNMQYDVFSLQYSQHTTYTTCRTSINAPPCRWCLRFSKTALTASLRRSVALSGAVRRCWRCRQRQLANTAASCVCEHALSTSTRCLHAAPQGKDNGFRVVAKR